MATIVKSALEQEFEDACVSDLAECRKLGYNPAYFVRMLHDYGAVETARRLLIDKNWPEGFTRLWMMKRVDLTLEACIHNNTKFQPFFTPQMLAECDDRLTQVGYI
jgi:hypothetical protein